MKKNGSCGAGYINPGGDKHAYLGHFRSQKVLERGHNVGAPKPMTQENAGGFGTPAPALEGGGGMRPPSATPSMESGGGLATPKPKPQSSVANAKSALTAAKSTGGDVAGAKAGLQTAKAGRREAFKEFGAAKTAFKSQGYGGGRAKALQTAKSNLKQNYSGAMKKYQTAQYNKAHQGGGFLSQLTGIAKKATGIGVAKKAVGAAKKVAGKMKP